MMAFLLRAKNQLAEKLDAAISDALAKSANSKIGASWQNLSANAQRVIKIALLLLLLSMIWAYVWLPAAKARDALQTRIPALETKLALMQTEAAEINRINAMPALTTSATTNAGTGGGNARLAADTAALQAVFGTSAAVSINEVRQFRIIIPNIAYTTSLDYLDTALSTYRLRVVSMKIKPIRPLQAKAEAEAEVKANANAKASNSGLAAKPNKTQTAVELILADDSVKK